MRIAVFLVLCMLLGTSTIFAAEYPKNLGHVQDRAQYFQEKDKKALRAEAVSGSLHYYILTIPSLGGEDSANFATGVYKKWELTKNDILIVIADQERRVEVNFNNKELQKKLDKLPADYDGDGNKNEKKLVEFVDKHFIPSAKEGDFTGAVRSLMTSMNKLMPAETAKPTEKPAAAGAQSPVKTEGTKKPEKTEKAEKPESSGEPINVAPFFIGVLIFFLFIAFIIAAIIILKRLFGGLKLKKKLAEVREQIAMQSVELAQALDSLTPLAEMSQGRTGAVVKDQEKQLTTLLLDTENIGKAMDADSIMVLNTKMLYYNLLLYTEHMVENEKKIAVVTRKANELADAEKKLGPFASRIAGNLNRIEIGINDMAQKLGSQLMPLRQSLEEAKNVLAKATEQSAFDVLSGTEWALKAERTCNALQSEYDELVELHGLLLGFPEQERNCRESVKEIIHIHNLHAFEADTLSLVDRSKTLSEQMLDELKQGQVSLARSLWEQCLKLLREAVTSITKLGELRRSNMDKAEALDHKLKQLIVTRDRLNDELLQLSHRYVKSLWAEMQEEYDNWQRDLAAASKDLDIAKTQTGDREQNFESAKNIFDDLAEDFETFEAAAASMLETIGQWDKANYDLRNQFDADLSLYNQAIEHCKTNRIFLTPEFIHDAESAIRTQSETFQNAATSSPCNLMLLEQYGNSFHETVASICTMIQRIEQNKYTAIQKLTMLDTSFKQQLVLAKGMLYKRKIKQSYNELKNAAERCIQTGMYEEALGWLKQLEEFVLSLSSANRIQSQLHANAQIQQQQRVQATRAAVYYQTTNEDREEYEERPRPKPPKPKSSSSWFSSSSSSNSSSRQPDKKPETKNSSGGSSWGSSSNSNSSGGSSFGGGSSKSSSGGSSFSGGSNKNSGGGNSSGGSNW
ncbi:TPM domain-containing protein [Paenibacillus sp. NPDC058174]|uniref:TPM domain-containing protein n=1 Tax=Paenibacillus sp. NPDC058174 TaxID=3346366 RepID=UPI0036D7E0A0